MRLDTDALIIGPHTEEEAFRLFLKNPAVAVAEQYPLTYSGIPIDFSGERNQISKYVSSLRSFARRPDLVWRLRQMYRAAVRQGYSMGKTSSAALIS
ncbi:MAG: hypothetical protein V4671_09465 [Armatimonadota bacterium]